MKNVNKKNYIIGNLILIIFLFCSCTIVYSNNEILISKNLYPNSIKTPQDIENWLKANFKYKPDRIDSDEWKSPEKTVKDKNGDCEDFAVLVSYILEDLGYKPIIIGIYTKDYKHAVLFFEETNNSWSFFSNLNYVKTEEDNLFLILYSYFPIWEQIKICTEKGYILKTFNRKDIEGGGGNEL